MAKSRSKKNVVANEKSDPVESGSIPPPRRPRTSADAIAELSDMPKGWAKAGSVIDSVRSIRTIFPGFNRGVRVGGLPTRRIHTVHGPTHGGKSAFVLGLVRSFVDSGHVAGYVDAEHSTPKQFADELMGRDIDTIPNLLGMRPESYEDTIDAVDSFLGWMKKRKKEENPDLASILVVDSINKLVPERELTRLKKEGAEAMDKGWGRFRAALNQAWLDHLVPLLSAADCALVLIAQEREDQEDTWGDAFKIKGGAALAFDASLLIRVSKAIPMRDGEGKDAPIYGFRHRARIWKSKVGHMDGRWSDTFFHLSNGTFVDAGFDTARDAISIGKDVGVVQLSGSWLSWGKKRWQGEHKAVQTIAKDPELLAELLTAVGDAVDREAGR